MKQEIRVKNGFSFNYQTSSNTGSIANIDPDNDDLIIEVDKIGESYYCNFHLKGIFIQIWCKSYEVRSIN